MTFAEEKSRDDPAYPVSEITDVFQLILIFLRAVSRPSPPSRPSGRPPGPSSLSGQLFSKINGNKIIGKIELFYFSPDFYSVSPPRPLFNPYFSLLSFFFFPSQSYQLIAHEKGGLMISIVRGAPFRGGRRVTPFWICP